MSLRAEHGNASSQFNLAQMYAKGEGVPVDNVQAQKWLDLAAAAGDKKAKELSKMIEKGMTTKQIVIPLGTVEVK